MRRILAIALLTTVFVLPRTGDAAVARATMATAS
jgi:hypothetical protein